MLENYPGDRKLCEGRSPKESSHPPDDQVDHGSEEVTDTIDGLVSHSEVLVPVHYIMSVAIIGVVNGVNHGQESICSPSVSSNSSGVLVLIFTESNFRLGEYGPSQSFTT